MSKRAIAWLIGGALALAAGILLLSMWANSHYSGLTPTTRAEIDSLDRSRPAFDSARSANVHAETGHVAAASTAIAGGQTTRANATIVAKQRDSLAHVADSLAVIARTRDAADAERANAWNLAYNAEHAAKLAADALADSLAAVADSNASAYEQEHAARVLADSRATADSARGTRAESVMHDAANDAENAGKCRVAWVIPCPSRKAAAVAGAVIGAATVEAVRIVVKAAKR